MSTCRCADPARSGACDIDCQCWHHSVARLCAEVCTSGCHADDCEHHGHIPATDKRQAGAAEHEHYWVDAADDETGWHCTICGVTEYPEPPGIESAIADMQAEMSEEIRTDQRPADIPRALGVETKDEGAG